MKRTRLGSRLAVSALLTAGVGIAATTTPASAAWPAPTTSCTTWASQPWGSTGYKAVAACGHYRWGDSRSIVAFQDCRIGVTRVVRQYGEPVKVYSGARSATEVCERPVQRGAFFIPG